MNEENQQNSQNPQVPQNQPVNATPERPHVTETPQKALRTYESDVADVLAHKNISRTRIALAESEKRSGESTIGDAIKEAGNAGESHHVVKKLLMALGGLILLGGGVGGAYYFYMKSPLAVVNTPQQNQSSGPTSVIPSDGYSVLAIDNMGPNQIIAAIKKEVGKITGTNTVKEIILTKGIGAQRARVTGPEIAKIMDIPAPDILTRALADNWMLGVYVNGNGDKDVFVVATNNYFQNAFAGMLQWEKTMADDLRQYVYGGSVADIANSTSDLMAQATSTAQLAASSTTASTTESATGTPSFSANYASNYTVVQGSFVDRIIKNKDVREFVTDNGPLFLYSFIDNSRLVVTGQESTLNALIDRLEQKAFVR
jgi:hypothetical protein